MLYEEIIQFLNVKVSKFFQRVQKLRSMETLKIGKTEWANHGNLFPNPGKQGNSGRYWEIQGNLEKKSVTENIKHLLYMLEKKIEKESGNSI